MIINIIKCFGLNNKKRDNNEKDNFINMNRLFGEKNETQRK